MMVSANLEPSASPRRAFSLPQEQWIGAGLLALALAAFLLPWFEVVRDGRVVITFNGLELVFGTNFQRGNPTGFVGTISGMFTAQAAFIGLLATLVVAVVRP